MKTNNLLLTLGLLACCAQSALGMMTPKKMLNKVSQAHAISTMNAQELSEHFNKTTDLEHQKKCVVQAVKLKEHDLAWAFLTTLKNKSNTWYCDAVDSIANDKTLYAPKYSTNSTITIDLTFLKDILKTLVYNADQEPLTTKSSFNKISLGLLGGSSFSMTLAKLLYIDFRCKITECTWCSTTTAPFYDPLLLQEHINSIENECSAFLFLFEQYVKYMLIFSNIFQDNYSDQVKELKRVNKYALDTIPKDKEQFIKDRITTLVNAFNQFDTTNKQRLIECIRMFDHHMVYNALPLQQPFKKAYDVNFKFDK